jgi:hypothetical protein
MRIKAKRTEGKKDQKPRRKKRSQRSGGRKPREEKGISNRRLQDNSISPLRNRASDKVASG